MLVFSTVAAVLNSINCRPILKCIYQIFSLTMNAHFNPYISANFAFISLSFFFFFPPLQ